MQAFLDYIKDYPALIITGQNRFYLSGFRSSLGYLFCTDGRLILYVDGRYIEAARKGVKSGVEVRLLTKLSDAIDELKAEFKFKELYLEEDISVRTFNGIKSYFPSATTSSKLSRILSEMRSIKTDYEKQQIVTAQRLAEKAFDKVLEFIKVGITERQVGLFLEYEMQSAGAEGMSFETIVVSGKNSSLPHGVPTNKPIENGDFVTMDFGAIFGGYCSDMTRTVAVGYADDTMCEVYNTVLKAQNAAINVACAGTHTSKVDIAARDVIEKAGYGNYFNHSTGHGVGIDIHEAPNLSFNSSEILNAGNVITCEPGIYIPEMYGVRIEDMLYITENGAENLTNSQKNLIIVK